MVSAMSVTGKQACETIVKALKIIDSNIEVKPTDIWNMESNGELWPVFELYELAKTFLNEANQP